MKVEFVGSIGNEAKLNVLLKEKKGVYTISERLEVTQHLWDNLPIETRREALAEEEMFAPLCAAIEEA